MPLGPGDEPRAEASAARGYAQDDNTLFEEPADFSGSAAERALKASAVRPGTVRKDTRDRSIQYVSEFWESRRPGGPIARPHSCSSPNLPQYLNAEASEICSEDALCDL
jgi:hypothetical protein